MKDLGMIVQVILPRINKMSCMDLAKIFFKDPGMSVQDILVFSELFIRCVDNLQLLHTIKLERVVSRKVHL